jgi:hypothetical protein
MALALCAVAACGTIPRRLMAQAAPRQPKAEAPKTSPSGSKGAAKASAPARQPVDEAASRAAVLDSPSWRDTLGRFNDWLAVQVLYDDEEVKRIRARLEAGIGRMSSAQLQTFEADLRAKLDVLTSDRALDAQDYLAEKFLVASDAYARRIRQQLPDVLSMTPGQIEQRLSIFASKRRSRADIQSSFEQSRDQRVAANSAKLKARQQRRPSRNTAAVQAASTNNNFTPARDYFPDTGSDTPTIFIGAGYW